MSPADLHSFFVSRIQVCRAWHCWWVAGISPQVGDLQQSEVPPATKQSWKSIYPKACCGKQKCHAISRFPRKRNQGHSISSQATDAGIEAIERMCRHPEESSRLHWVKWKTLQRAHCDPSASTNRCFGTWEPRLTFNPTKRATIADCLTLGCAGSVGTRAFGC